MFLIDLIKSIDISNDTILMVCELLLAIIALSITNLKTKKWRDANTVLGKIFLYIVEHISFLPSKGVDKKLKLPGTDSTKEKTE